MTSKTDADVIEHVRSFLQSEADINGTLIFRAESGDALFFYGHSNDGIKEEVKVSKENGEVFSRPYETVEWIATDIDCDCFRICTHCKQLMIKGFVIEDGEEYFCSEEHLHTTYTKEEYEEMYDDGEGNTYWTEW